MLFRPPVGRRALPSALTLIMLALAASSLGCPRPKPCQDPTREGVCFCPVGISCHHECGQATGHCTLGCSQANPSCSVSCNDDCTALCSGAGRCDAVCGAHCNVSCEWVKERCTAVMGPESRVNCEGAADCDIRCNGPCQVACPNGHCRLLCARRTDGAGGDGGDSAEQAERGCEMTCGGAGEADRPLLCPDGSRVCGRPC